MKKRACCEVMRACAIVALMTAAGAVPALAAPAGEIAAARQEPVSATDLQRLQDELDEVRDAVDSLSTSEARRVDRESVTDEITEIDDELAYLRVKLRRDEPITHDELAALDERVRRLQSELEPEPSEAEVTVPVGTVMDVRLQSSLSSDTAQAEDRFFATVVSDVRVDGQVAIPAGSEVRGVVSAVDRSSRTDRTASLTLTFDQLTVERRTYPARLTLTEAQESGLRDEAGRIGIGAAVGGILGGLFGGGRGALTGVLIGAGGTVAATEGRDVELPAGTVLPVRFDTAVAIISE